MNTISLDEFLKKYGSELKKNTIEETNDAVMNKVSELSSKGIEVVGMREVINEANKVNKKVSDQSESNELISSYNIKRNTAAADYLLGLGTIGGAAGIRAGYKAQKNIFTPNRGVDIIKYINRNIIQQPDSINPKVKGSTTMDIVDYFSNLSKEKVNAIDKNPYGKFRGLFNEIVDDLDDVIEKRNAILDRNANKTVSYEILDPLKKEIDSLGVGGQYGDKKKDLEAVYKEVEKLIKENGGKINIKDAETIKETAYEGYDFVKSSQTAATAKDVNRGLANKLLGQGTKKAIEDTVGEGIEQRNKSYGKLKNISKGVGISTNRFDKLPRYTSLDIIRNKFGETVSAVPGISALGNIGGTVPQIAADEKKLTDIIKRTGRWSNKLKPLMEKAENTAKKIEAAANKPGFKKLPFIGKTLSAIGLSLGLMDIATMSNAGYEIDDNLGFKNRLLQGPIYPDTKIGDVDEETKKAVEKYNKQLEEKQSKGLVESQIATPRSQQLLNLGVAFSPIGLATIPTDILGREQGPEEFSSLVGQERLKKEQMKQSSIPGAGSVSQITGNDDLLNNK